MANDAHSTNFAENKEFFLNPNDPTNFERTWKNITFVYRELGLIGTPVRFDEVMDFSVIKQLDAEGAFRNQKDESRTSFAPSTLHRRSRPRRRSSPRPSASTSTPTRPTSSSRSTTSWATPSPTPSTTPT